MNLFLQQRACETKDHCQPLLLVAGASRRFQLTKLIPITNVESLCSWTHLHFLHPGATTVLPLLLLTAHQKTDLESALKNSMESSYGTPLPVTVCSKRGDTFLPTLFLDLLLQMVIKI